MLRLQLQIIGRATVIGALTLLAGCAGGKRPAVLSGTTGGWYSVTANTTPFYRYGPQQGNGPDQQLSHDSLLKVIRPSFGYVKVQLQGGATGYVASEDIAPASSALVAEKLAPPPPPTTIASHGEEFRLDSTDPRLIPPPEPLPQASVDPNYRY